MAENRIPLATNCVLIETGQTRLLIDTGPGDKLTTKEREIFALQGGTVWENLSAAGLAPESIDYVVLSHLHFDHAGGGTRRRDDTIAASFPSAIYCIQEREWEAANGGRLEWEGSYPPENFACLADSGQLRLLRDAEEIVPGIHGIWTGGHSPGHQVIRIEDEGQVAIYLGDLCPTWQHLPRMWCMAYDANLAEVRRKKPEIFGEIADTGSGLFPITIRRPRLSAWHVTRDKSSWFWNHGPRSRPGSCFGYGRYPVRRREFGDVPNLEPPTSTTPSPVEISCVPQQRRSDYCQLVIDDAIKQFQSTRLSRQ